MIISVINLSHGALADEQLQRALRVVNRQISEDFAQYWGFGAELRLEGRSGRQTPTQEPADMRGEAVLYVWDRIDPDADGYHWKYNSGVPYGIVFLGVAELLAEDWTVTLSHEALELLADPEANLRVVGPHPSDRRRRVFHWCEMCDAVQDESYEIDGVRVSNFVLPSYFTGGEEQFGRNDFLGTSHDGKTLRSFGVNPGGYISYFDPRLSPHGRDTSYSRPGDARAAKRQRAQRKASHRRRGSP